MTNSMEPLNQLSEPSIVQRAQAGEHEAIAHWLNAYLMPQGVYARVALDRPGCLLVLVEFNQSPDRSRLIRFICHRLCQLQSIPFTAIRLLARFIGTSFILWDQTVHLAHFKSPRLRRRRALPTINSALSAIVPAPASPSGQPAPAQAKRLNALAKVEPMPTHAVGKIPLTLPILAGSTLAALVVGAGVGVVLQPNLVERPKSGKATVAIAPNSRQSPHQSPQLANTQSLNTEITKIQTSIGRLPVRPIAVADRAGTAVTLAFASEAVVRDLLDDQGGDRAPSPALDPYTQADLSVANLNAPLASSESEPIDQSAIEQLRQRGVDIVTLAPAPAQPLRPTLDNLDSAGIGVIGSGRNRRQARQPDIVEVRGQRIAYLGYHDSDTATARWWRSGSNQAIDAQITADIQAIRPQVDWVVVNYRWSGNLAEYPADWQVRLAHHAIDQGADLVVGHHPTVLQGAEVYKGRAIAYSLGDFIYANSQAAQQNYNTAVLKVALRGKQMRLELLPVQVRQSRPAIVEGEDGKAILRYLQQASGLFDQPLQTPMVLDGRSATPVPLAPAATPGSLAPLSESADSFTEYSDEDSLAPIDAPEELPPAAEPESQTDATVEEWSAEDAWVEEAPPEAPADFSVEDEFVDEW